MSNKDYKVIEMDSSEIIIKKADNVFIGITEDISGETAVVFAESMHDIMAAIERFDDEQNAKLLLREEYMKKEEHFRNSGKTTIANSYRVKLEKLMG
jgi:hypothetical protein